MVVAEAPRLYPVFTHHAKELQAAARYLVRQMERCSKSEKPDEKFNALMNRHRQVLRTLLLMQDSKNPFVYLNEDERELVVRVNTWLKAHPENRTA